MRKTLVCALAAALALTVVAPSGAARKVVRLGSDPAGDAPPSVDITFLDVTRSEDDLEIRIGIDKMIPVTGGYGEGPVEWVFMAGKRTFIAEALSGRTPRFFLFEVMGDTYEQLTAPTGTYSADDGFARILVPLETIGAKTGTKIVGFQDAIPAIDKPGGQDVDSHVHTVGTQYLDTFKTTRGYLVP